MFPKKDSATNLFSLGTFRHCVFVKNTAIKYRTLYLCMFWILVRKPGYDSPPHLPTQLKFSINLKFHDTFRVCEQQTPVHWDLMKGFRTVWKYSKTRYGLLKIIYWTRNMKYPAGRYKKEKYYFVSFNVILHAVLSLRMLFY